MRIGRAIGQDPAEAERAADYALAVAPADETTRRLARLIDSVLAGERQCPRGIGDV